MPDVHTLLQCGLPKSGNFWLYRLLQNCLQQAGVDTTNFIQTQPIYDVAQGWDLSFEEQADIDVLDVTETGCYYRISSIFRHPISDLDAYVRQTPHVWTHSPYCGATPRVFPKFDRIVYLVRDPRDVLLSMARFAFTPYMQRYYPQPYDTPSAYLDAHLESKMGIWVDHVGPYLARANELGLHVLFYERLLQDFDAELRRLLDFLGVSLTEAKRSAVADAVAFESMKEQDPDHVRKGKAGKWRTQLSDEQKGRALHLVRPMIDRLGYPLNDDESEEIRPSVPSEFSTAELESIRHHVRRPTVTAKMRGWARSMYDSLTP